uniref:Uncharacterized protein n=1 Tax=Myoviridae sp. ctisV53 TaxID=2825156 RepID=A0A8S5PLS9_9CAUD|nr:MAG TPA: hypothetical protein [Myoviridae sp. ctisV53]DAE49475.1 MAG TPA: hypothetical protein [Bacteriophage sp.]
MTGALPAVEGLVLLTFSIHGCKRLLHPTRIGYHAAREMSSAVMTASHPPDIRRSRALSARSPPSRPRSCPRSAAGTCSGW